MKLSPRCLSKPKSAKLTMHNYLEAPRFIHSANQINIRDNPSFFQIVIGFGDVIIPKPDRVKYRMISDIFKVDRRDQFAARGLDQHLGLCLSAPGLTFGSIEPYKKLEQRITNT